LIITLALGYSPKVGLGVAVALAQIGEFSFLLATLGTHLRALPEEAMNPIVAGAIISITLNPILYRAVPRMDTFIRRQRRLSGLLNGRRGDDLEHLAPPRTTPVHRAIVVGYGPIGQTVVRLLSDRQIEPSVIEMNVETVRRLRGEGIRAIHGDVNQNEVLEQAGVADAMSLILSASGSAAVEAIRTARRHNPRILVIARADFLKETELMRRAGADEVFSGEGEVALAMTGSILRHIGSTPAQLDEAEEWIRTRLFAGDSAQAAVPRAAADRADSSG
jgi:CPA2 family monovalent cation:H+ antiporter-2